MSDSSSSTFPSGSSPGLRLTQGCLPSQRSSGRLREAFSKEAVWKRVLAALTTLPLFHKGPQEGARGQLNNRFASDERLCRAPLLASWINFPVSQVQAWGGTPEKRQRHELHFHMGPGTWVSVSALIISVIMVSTKAERVRGWVSLLTSV